MNIAAVSSAGAAMQNTAAASSAGDASSAFKDVLGKLIGEVNTTDSAYQGDIIKAAEGELDNPHQLLIDSSRATVALQMLTSVRSEALDAYDSIIKMQV